MWVCVSRTLLCGGSWFGWFWVYDLVGCWESWFCFGDDGFSGLVWRILVCDLWGGSFGWVCGFECGGL